MDFQGCIWGKIADIVSQFFEVDCQHCQSLVVIIMEFAGNSSAFLLLSLDQSATQSGHRIFCHLALGDIDARTYVSGERLIWVESGHTNIEHPTIFSIVA